MAKLKGRAMTKTIFFAFALTLSFSAQAACPKISSSPIGKSEMVEAMTKAYATTNTTLGNCTQIVTDAIDASAVEESTSEHGMLVRTAGIKTTNVFRCESTTEDGKKLLAYGKIEKFEPTANPRSSSFEVVSGSGEKCDAPKGIFYRLSNTYRSAE
jgi:hypothetical protein